MSGIVRWQWLSDFDDLKPGLSPVSLACTMRSGCLLPAMRHAYTGGSSACSAAPNFAASLTGTVTELIRYCAELGLLMRTATQCLMDLPESLTGE